MTRDVVMATERMRDQLIVDGTFRSDAWVSVGLARGGDFYLKIEFTGLPKEQYWKAVALAKLNREMTIQSGFISREKYDITHIVIEKFMTDNQFNMTWECLSDKPGGSLII